MLFTTNDVPIQVVSRRLAAISPLVYLPTKFSGTGVELLKGEQLRRDLSFESGAYEDLCQGSTMKSAQQ